MREPVVHHEDPELEYNMWGYNYLQYKGELFTGTLIYDDTDPVSYTEYKNGYCDGEEVIYYESGQLAEKGFNKNGERISTTEWYENGRLKYAEGCLYDPEGKTIRINGDWLYPNGTKRDGEGEGEYYLFSSNGELAIKTIIRNSGDYRNMNIYYDKVLSECYYELLLNYYPDLDELFYNVEYKIWGWAAKKYWKNKREGLEIYQKLAKHPNQNVARTAQDILEQIRKKEFRAISHFKNLGYRTKIR